jgi:hypothetical protein
MGRPVKNNLPSWAAVLFGIGAYLGLVALIGVICNTI